MSQDSVLVSWHGKVPACNGEGVDGEHCCYVGGRECEYLVRNQAGRRFACALMIKYGIPDFLNSDEYKKVGDFWASSTADLGFDYCYTFNPAGCCQAEAVQ